MKKNSLCQKMVESLSLNAGVKEVSNALLNLLLPRPDPVKWKKMNRWMDGWI